MLNGTVIHQNFKPESPYVARYKGVETDSIRSRAFSFGEFDMGRFKRKDAEAPICACGCGERVKWDKWHNNGRWNKFINGHGRRGAKNTEVSKKAVSIANTKFDSLKEHLLDKTEIKTDNECWLYIGTQDKDGYGQLKHKGKQFRTHRIAYEIYIGPIPDGMFICHHCDNPPCVNPKHLFLGTPKDNLMDASKKGRLFPRPKTKKKMSIAKTGSKNSFYNKKHLIKTKRALSLACGKLTTEQVNEIRKLSKSGISGKYLAELFCISQGAISLIVNNKTYRFIKEK